VRAAIPAIRACTARSNRRRRFGPQRLIVLETAGWPALDEGSRQAFEGLLGRLRDDGIRILRRSDESAIELFEQSIASAAAITRDINGYENRAAYEDLYEQHPDQLSPDLIDGIMRARKLTLEDYRGRLSERAEGQRRFVALAPLADALITLGSHGPASAPANRPDASVPPPTGDVAFNLPASILFAPAVNVPLLMVDGLPLGIQLVGQTHQDARVVGVARWFANSLAT
jgi:Asp-tRNA(Asn)/Glu-tRNA(Gln) amidotransferase A subunit family amidase